MRIRHAFLFSKFQCTLLKMIIFGLDSTLGLLLDVLFLRLLSIDIHVILSNRNNYGSELWLWDGPHLPHLMPRLPAGGGL